MVCRKCRAVVFVQLNETVRTPGACPVCRDEWFTDSHGPIDDLARALKGLTQAKAGDTYHFDVRIEMADPTAKA